MAFRHFPVRSSHPRAQAAACAAEAAAAAGRVLAVSTTRCSPTRAASRTRTCGRAPSALGLDLARFDADRRSDAVAERVRGDFRGGIRAGVATTPTLFVDGVRHAGRPDAAAVGCAARLDRTRTAVRLARIPARSMAPSDAQLIQRVRADETGEAMRALYRTYAGELTASR